MAALQEVDELCAEWQPEPLAAPLPAAQRDYEPPVISRWAAGLRRWRRPCDAGSIIHRTGFCTSSLKLSGMLSCHSLRVQRSSSPDSRPVNEDLKHHRHLPVASDGVVLRLCTCARAACTGCWGVASRGEAWLHGVKGRGSRGMAAEGVENEGAGVALRSAAGVWVVANGKRVLNMASLNFLSIAGDPTIRVPAIP